MRRRSPDRANDFADFPGLAVYRVQSAPYTDDAMSTKTTTPRTLPSRGRLMWTLFAAQVCGSTGHSIGMAIGGIMAAGITGTNTWSGMPVAVGALGTALASWPLSRLMERSGRRPGLALGYGLAVLGALVAMAAVTTRSFPLLLGGMALFGVSQTSNLLARYAAADVSSGAQRGRAMGLIVWGSSAGSILGPNLMEPALRLVRPRARSQRVPDQRRRLRGGGAPRRALPAPRPAGRRAPAARGRLDRTPGRAGARPRRDPGRRPRAARAGDAHDEPVRHDQHDLDVTGLSARPGSHRADDRTGGVPPSRRHVRGLAAIGVALRSPWPAPDDRRRCARADRRRDAYRSRAGQRSRAGHPRSVSERRRLELRVRGRQRAPDRCAFARRAGVHARPRGPVHGADGRLRLRGRRHDSGRVGLRRPQCDRRGAGPRPAGRHVAAPAGAGQSFHATRLRPPRALGGLLVVVVVVVVLVVAVAVIVLITLGC